MTIEERSDEHPFVISNRSRTIGDNGYMMECGRVHERATGSIICGLPGRGSDAGDCERRADSNGSSARGQGGLKPTSHVTLSPYV